MNTKTKTTRPAVKTNTKTKTPAMTITEKSRAAARRTASIAGTAAISTGIAAIEITAVIARTAAYVACYSKTMATADWSESPDKTERRSHANGVAATESVEALYDRLGF